MTKMLVFVCDSEGGIRFNVPFLRIFGETISGVPIIPSIDVEMIQAGDA